MTTAVDHLCPGCLQKLPDDYPYDHVAIDRALAGDTSAFAAMDTAERQETVREGRARGLADNTIGTRVGIAIGTVRRLMGEPIFSRGRPPKKEAADKLRELWAQGLSDREIANHLDKHVNTVWGARVRLGLPANYPRGGRRKREVAA